MAKYILKVINPTWLKQSTIHSRDITDPKQKHQLEPGTYPVHSYRYDRSTNHYKIAFLSNSFRDRNTWWVHKDNDIVILKDGVINGWGSGHNPLNVKWFSQLDSNYEPFATCNVASVAMCLDYFGIRPKNPLQQLEDELYEYLVFSLGLDITVAENLARLIQDYGCQDDFQYYANWADVKHWINQGNPAIVHGYFTEPGHIMVIIGYNDQGWIVNDPNGRWNGLVRQAWSYDTNANGEAITYPYDWMEAACGPFSDNTLWIHYVSK